MEKGDEGVQGSGLGCARGLVPVHELPDHAERHRRDGHGHEDQRLDQRLVAHAVEQHRERKAERQHEKGVEDQPDQHVVADRDPGASAWEVGELARVVLQPHEVSVVVLHALDHGGDRRYQQDAADDDECRSDPKPGPDLRAILVRQAPDEVLAAHDVGDEYRRHADDDDKARRNVLQQNAEVHALYLLVDYDLYADACTVSSVFRIESSFDWFWMKSRRPFQAAFLMSAGMLSVASYLAIWVVTMIC